MPVCAPLLSWLSSTAWVLVWSVVVWSVVFASLPAGSVSVSSGSASDVSAELVLVVFSVVPACVWFVVLLLFKLSFFIRTNSPMIVAITAIILFVNNGPKQETSSTPDENVNHDLNNKKDETITYTKNPNYPKRKGS